MVDIPEVKPRGRPRKGPNNTRVRDNPELYNAYHRNYYHNSGLSEKTWCPLCLRTVSRQKLARHQKTKLCEKYRCHDNPDNFDFQESEEYKRWEKAVTEKAAEIPDDSDDDNDFYRHALLHTSYVAILKDTLDKSALRI